MTKPPVKNRRGSNRIAPPASSGRGNRRSRPVPVSRNSPIFRPLKKSEGKTFLALIDALADFEKLSRPGPAARRRLLRDATGRNRRFDAYLATVDGKAVGYAILFETYSSFLALPTLYLEDIFILPEYRKLGIGERFFKFSLREAKKRGCGRMEWVVLDWNKNAIRFYERLRARWMKEWLLYRISF